MTPGKTGVEGMAVKGEAVSKRGNSEVRYLPLKQIYESIMNTKEFFEKVAAMRTAQKGFFRTTRNDPEHNRFYSESRKLEAEIDTEIERVRNITNNES